MIALEGLSMDLGGFRLESLSLRVAPGEFFMIVGPSGAGKTLLLEAVADDPTSCTWPLVANLTNSGHNQFLLRERGRRLASGALLDKGKSQRKKRKKSADAVFWLDVAKIITENGSG